MNKTLGDRFLQVIEKAKPFPNSSSASNLPSISLNQLEKQVNSMKKKRYIKQNSDDSLVTNNKQFNVCSPFYDRMKAHKQNCKCPYHRKKRFSLLPVRHSEKLGNTLNTSFQKPQQHQHENTFYRFSNKQGYQSTKANLLNKSLDQIDNSKLSHTQEFSFKPKVDTRNITYEAFLKDCQYHLLKKKGFSLIKPTHVVRKGVKEIFEFINNHLDYTVDKMTQWVNTIQKDKDYGEFYVQRFKQMKTNYELGLMKRMAKTQLDGQDGNYFSKANNSTSSNFRSKQTLSALRREKRNKQLGNKDKDSQQQSNIEGIKHHSLSQGDYDQHAAKMSQIFLNKIFSELKNQNTISKQSAQDLMKMDAKQFKQLFSALQNSLLSQKYTDEMLQKFDSGVLSELMKRYSISESSFSSKSPSKSSSFSDIKSKLDMIKKTQQILKKHRSRKLSLLSQNSLNFNSTSKQFLGSKKNTQNAENSKNNITSHSKKSSNGDCSLSGDSQKYSNDSDTDQKLTTEVNFQAIEEENQLQEENLSDAQRMLKAIVNFGPKARRSKVFRPEDLFNFHNSFRDDQDDSENQFEKSRRVIQLHKGIFRKAQKYLFDINMGKTIITKDDSLFTAKRKMRVIKALLKQNPNSPQADQLRSYVKQIQQKIYLKTQKDKKLALQKKSFEIQQVEESDPWKQISLDNLGYNLIFYNLTSKIGTDDNEDLCILLNEWKLGNHRKFENRLSFHLNLVTDDEEIRKSKKKTQVDDILVQQGMRNMEFQDELQSEKQIDIKNQSKRTTKTLRRSLLQLNNMAKNPKLSGFFRQSSFNQLLTEDEFNRMNDSEIQAYHYKIKKMFKYAKIRFPQTFDKYVKNSLVNNVNNGFQNSDIDFSVFTY